MRCCILFLNVLGIWPSVHLGFLLYWVHNASHSISPHSISIMTHLKMDNFTAQIHSCRSQFWRLRAWTSHDEDHMTDARIISMVHVASPEARQQSREREVCSFLTTIFMRINSVVPMKTTSLQKECPQWLKNLAGSIFERFHTISQHHHQGASFQHMKV